MCVCMSIRVCVSVCVCVHHIFFIYSSVDGYLGCFYILATLNSAAMNIGVYVSFRISALFFWYIFENGISGSYGSSICGFWETSIVFPQWLNQFAFLPTVIRGLPFFLTQFFQEMISSFYSSSPFLTSSRRTLHKLFSCHLFILKNNCLFIVNCFKVFTVSPGLA